MKANIINNKKNTTMRKIVPAAGMLTISAVMLATSTYAWFTMSKEVDVTGIQMTASVPENIQISLGAGTGVALSSASFAEVSGTSRTLTVSDPVGTAGSTDWTNTVDISGHYTFGHLTPATSKNGAHIYFTQDAEAAGVKLPEDMTAAEKAASGKSVATFAQADTAATSVLQGWAEPNDTFGVSMGDTYTAKDKNGGGYYIDIPVWFRTSIYGASGNVNMAVIATFYPGTENDGTATPVANASVPDLYKAARVALIDSTGASVGAIMDSSTKYYHNSTKTQSTAGYSAADAYTIDAATAANATANTWAAVDAVTQATAVDASTGLATGGEAVVAIPKSTTDGAYSSGVKYTLRVWLDGEDINCWDQTAGQDFRIDLRFIRMPEA